MSLDVLYKLGWVVDYSVADNGITSPLTKDWRQTLRTKFALCILSKGTVPIP